MRYLVVLFIIITSPANADPICDDLWLSRNMIFAQHGYCFKSSLGQALFSDHQCVPDGIKLSQEASALIEQIKVREVEENCAGKVDTSRQTLDVPALKSRMKIEVQPILTPYESSCVGYRRLDDPELFTAPRLNADVTGTIGPGDTIDYMHQAIGDWEFVTVYKPKLPTIVGWVHRLRLDENSCIIAAG